MHSNNSHGNRHLAFQCARESILGALSVWCFIHLLPANGENPDLSPTTKIPHFRTQTRKPNKPPQEGDSGEFVNAPKIVQRATLPVSHDIEKLELELTKLAVKLPASRNDNRAFRKLAWQLVISDSRRAMLFGVRNCFPYMTQDIFLDLLPQRVALDLEVGVNYFDCIQSATDRERAVKAFLHVQAIGGTTGHSNNGGSPCR